MGTKNNPGRYDCYANAEPDEPMFILLGRDARAPALVEEWAQLAELRGDDPEKVAEARQCARAMRDWRTAVELRESNARGGEDAGTCRMYGVYWSSSFAAR